MEQTWKTANAVEPSDEGTRAKCPKATKKSERHEGQLPDSRDTKRINKGTKAKSTKATHPQSKEGREGPLPESSMNAQRGNDMYHLGRENKRTREQRNKCTRGGEPGGGGGQGRWV